MTDQVKVGDWVARIKTRKLIVKPTDKKDVPFKIIKIKERTAIGEDCNIHYIDNLYHVKTK